MKHTIFMHVTTTPTWLKMPPRERFAFIDEVIKPILKKHPQVSMRYFDSEGFTGKCTDVLMWETLDLVEYQKVVEQLRETLFWGTYFEIEDIIPAFEDAYADYYQVDKISG